MEVTLQLKISGKLKTLPDALDDGDLIDVSGVAADVGYAVPVMITAAIWNELIDGYEQSTTSRLWDVLLAADTRITRRVELAWRTGYLWHIYWSIYRWISRNPRAEDTITFDLEMFVKGEDMRVALQVMRVLSDDGSQVLYLVIMGFN